MEMSIREAKARFSEAIAAVERGESVIVTKYGRPVAELSQPRPRTRKIDLAAANALLAERGWPIGEDLWPTSFDDPAFSRQVLGLED